MKPNIALKFCLLAATLLSLPLAGRADDPAPALLSGPAGLLGQTYADLTYTYIDLDNSSTHADDYHFGYNQALKTGLDGILAYDWTQTNSSAKEQSINAALRAFSASYAWGKPYVEAGAGYAWTKVAGVKDNSVLWEVAVGVELQAAPGLTVTPYVKYADAPDLARGSMWNFGLKANYWIDSQWAITGGLNRDDDHNMGYTVGTSFRF